MLQKKKERKTEIGEIRFPLKSDAPEIRFGGMVGGWMVFDHI